MENDNALMRLIPTRVIAGLAAGDVDIKQAAAQDPGTALAIVARSYSEGDAKLTVLAKGIDTVLAFIGDPDEARDMLDAHVTAQAQAELTAVHGDRLSVILLVAQREVVLAALEIDATDTKELAQTMFLIRAWAQNLAKREDWEDLLEEEVGEYTLRDLLIHAIVREFGDDVTPDVWVSVGLDPDEASEHLAELLDDGDFPVIDELDVQRAFKVLRDKRQAFEADTSSAALADLVQEVEI